MKTFFLVLIDKRDGTSAIPASPAAHCMYIPCSKGGGAHGVQYGCWQEVKAASWKSACEKASRDCGTFHSYGGKAQYQ